MLYLCPNNSFASFDKNKMIQLCEYYSIDFGTVDILKLDKYILDMCIDTDIWGNYKILVILHDLNSFRGYHYNRIGNIGLNDSFIGHNEKVIFENNENNVIMKRYQSIRIYRDQL